MVKRLLEALLLAAVLFSAWYGREAWLTSHVGPRLGAVRALAPPPPESAPPPPSLAAAPPAAFSASETALMQKIQALFATGDFVAALRVADAALEDAKTSDALRAWLTEQMPVLLTSAGWSKLKLGECEDATVYFRRSEAMKRTPETAKGLAVCYYKQKNLAGAREQFTWYLYKQPGDFQMQLLYTDVLESDGRFDEAVKILEALVAAPPSTDPAADPRPDPVALKQRLESMRGRLKESVFQQYETSKNFRLTYRAGDHEDLVAYVLSTLEDALDEYVEEGGLHTPAEKIEVNLYPASDFKSIVAGGPEWAEGLFDGRLRIPVRQETVDSGRYDGLYVVLRHELVHALFALMTDSRPLPPWFDEGMAQRLSCNNQPCGSFQYDMEPGAFLPLASFNAPYISLSAVSAGRAYRQSLFLILLIERRYGDEALNKIVGHITTSSDLSSDALLAPLGTNFKDLVALAGSLWAARRPPK